MSQSAFARRMLEKQGWKEGDGLGKKKDGISEPIKVNLKMDKTGVGHNPGSDFTDHWWLRVFNDAASSNSNTNEDLTITEKETPRSVLYQGFRKGSTLNKGKEEKDSDCSSDEETDQNQDPSSLPTLDDLHKYCGGATGHRAATLGIKMKGKLHRAAEQERQFNEGLKKTNGTVNPMDKDSTLDQSEERRKKKKKKKKESVEQTVVEVATDSLLEENGCESNSRVSEECEDCDINNDDIQRKMKKHKKSKKKKKRVREDDLCDTEDNSTTTVTEECDESAEPPKKKKKKRKADEEIHAVVTETEVDVECLKTDEKSKHKKKKKKNKD